MPRKHWKQRSSKSSSISERHFRRRLFERYGLRVQEITVRVVYDKTVKALATALPLETAQRDSDNTKETKSGQRLTNYGQSRDSDGTATAAANGDLPVPQDCQARAEGIAHD